MRLPTLSFECWSENTGVRHNYYEKDMRSLVLMHKQSSQSEQFKYIILVNELQRCFHKLDKDMNLEEKIEIVDHYSHQLSNLGY